VKRRPAPSVVLAPVRLTRFAADEWAVPPFKERASDWEAEHWSALGPFYAWRDARRMWSADHGDALGNTLERFQFERAVRSAHYSTVKDS
jgi:hypothetical protein